MMRRDLKKEDEGDATWEIALRILNYLAENPQAADTVEGILQWWLLERTIVEEQQAVEGALYLLVELDLIIEVGAADARRHYHLNAERIEMVRKLIREAE
jgi:hypothetical protein